MKVDRIVPDIIRSLKKKDIILRNPVATRPCQHSRAFKWLLLLGQKLLNKKLKKVIIPNWNF